MTNKQLNSKLSIMYRDILPYLRKECKRLADSGGIDVSGAEDDFRIPNIILYVALKNLAEQYRPYYYLNKKEAKNLLHF